MKSKEEIAKTQKILRDLEELLEKNEGNYKSIQGEKITLDNKTFIIGRAEEYWREEVIDGEKGRVIFELVVDKTKSGMLVALYKDSGIELHMIIDPPVELSKKPPYNEVWYISSTDWKGEL